MGSTHIDSLNHPIADRFALPVENWYSDGISRAIEFSDRHCASRRNEHYHTQQTPGSQRTSAIAAMRGILSALWAGIFVVEPSAKTGIHHDGEQDTVV